MKGNRGFTLVELMIVITVAAVGITLAVPSFNDLIERKALGGAAEAAYEQLQRARSQAVKRSKPIIVDFHVSGTNWAIAFTDKMGGCNAEDNSLFTGCTVDEDNNAANFSPQLLMKISGSDYKNITMSKVNPGFANPAIWSGGCTTATLHDERACFDFLRGLSRTGAFDFTSANYTLRVEVDQLGRVNVCVPSTKKDIVGYDGC